MKLFRRELIMPFFVSVCVVAECSMLVACGGSNGLSKTYSPFEASSAVSSATTPGAMHQAFDEVAISAGFGKVPVKTGSTTTFALPSDVQQAYEELQLNEPATDYPSFASAFATVNNDPSLASIKLNMTVDQVLADLNFKLERAYANPTQGQNPTLIMLSQFPVSAGSKVPVITASTPMSPIQRMMLPEYLSLIQFGDSSACTIACYAAYYAAIGLIAAAAAECALDTGFIGTALCAALAQAAKDAASRALNSCLASCHDQ